MEEWKADSDFDLTPFIDELPAARFFWYDRITEAQKPRFLQLLAALYQLFITPHFIPVPPNQDCSYLKKMEHLFSADHNDISLTTNIITILKQADNPELDASDDRVLGWLPHTGFGELDYVLNKVIDNKEDSRILKWYHNKKHSLLLLRVMFVEPLRSTTIGHATFLVLRKTKLGFVQYIYVDSHGYEVQNTHYAVQTHLKTNLRQYLESLLGPDVQLEHVLHQCPLLQRFEQGGNCRQWSLFIMALFVSQPDLFDRLTGTLYKLSVYPTLSIHLFSLSVFLRTLPRVGLQRYLRETIVPSRWSPQILDWCLDEDTKMRRAVSHQFGVPDCYSSRRNCRAPCLQSGRRCMFRTASSNGKFLSSKEIASKMLHLYAEIWDMTGHDPNSMSDEQIHKQLDFPDFTKREEDEEAFKAAFELTEADLELRERLMNE